MILATVSQDPDFHKDVRASLDGHLRFEAAWDLGYEDAARLLGVSAEEKCLLILDFGDPLLALPVARAVDGRPQISSIAVKGGGNREEMVQLMQVGVRDVLTSFTARELRQAATRVSAKLASSDDVLGDLFAFMPAKPGCGASTIATYATAIASQNTQDPTLLLDFDVRLGVTSFLLKAEGIHTIADALLQADHMDEDLWSSLVARLGNLHLLGSGPVDFSHQVPTDRYATLLDFAVRRYSLVSVDLPGTMEDGETQTLMRSNLIVVQHQHVRCQAIQRRGPSRGVFGDLVGHAVPYRRRVKNFEQLEASFDCLSSERFLRPCVLLRNRRCAARSTQG